MTALSAWTVRVGPQGNLLLERDNIHIGFNDKATLADLLRHANKTDLMSRTIAEAAHGVTAPESVTITGPIDVDEPYQPLCISCRGSGKAPNLGGGPGDCTVCKGTGYKQPAPYPLGSHDPKDWCRHPNCRDTNWCGRDRIHSRSPNCPPDMAADHLWFGGGAFPGWVAVGADWDRAHYLPYVPRST